MNFLPKTLFKLKLFFTNPKKFFMILRDIIKVELFPDTEAKEGKKFTTEIESIALSKYASSATLGVVEIGVLDGLTTQEMSRGCRVPIYGIDPIIPDSMNKRLVGSEQKIRDNMKNYPQFYFFKDFSFNLAKNWNKPFDFIFIDGDHNYNAVKQDFEDWLPHLASGGVVAFHDSAKVISIPTEFEGWPGPIKLVQELKIDSRVEFVETKDSLSVFRKKG